MTNPSFWSMQRAAGALLVLAVLPLALGVFLFLSRNGLTGGAPRSPALFAWERGSILTAVVLVALGLLLLEGALQQTEGRLLARMGSGAFFFGAVLLVTAEAMQLTTGTVAYPLIVIYVLMAFLGQAAIGGALLQTGFVPAWVGWATIIWNGALFLVLPLVTPDDVYYPIQHHVMPLLIGLSLLVRG